MKPITRTLVALFLLVASWASAQPLITNFTPANLTVSVNGNADLQLKVKNFTNITSIQFTIKYEQSLLQFVSMDNFTLPGFSAGNFNHSATAGTIKVSWSPDFGQYPSGYTTADNTTILALHFKGLVNGTSSLNITTLAPGIEITRNFQNIALDYQTGGSTIQVGSGGPPPLTGFKIVANTIYIPKDSTRCMPVTVNDFNNIISMQYAMHWDKTVLEYVKTQDYTLPGLTASSFSGNQSTGTLTMGWDDPDASGETKTNGSSIYKVCFKGIGTPPASSIITIDGIGLPPSAGTAEAFNAASQNVWTSTTPIKDTIFVTAPAPPANALTFYVVSDTTGQGGQACVEVRVKNFIDVVSTQFALSFDQTKLQFVSVTPGTVPGLTTGNFNTSVAGQVRISWLDPDVAGIDLADNTLLFKVCFTAIPAPTVTIPVTVGAATGYPAETVKDPGGEVQPAFQNGHVLVDNIIPSFNVTATGTNISCSGGNNGAVSTTTDANNPSYAWMGPGGPINQTTAAITGLSVAGTYTVTVTAAGGGTKTATVTLSMPQALSATSQTTNVNCNGGADGSINLTPAGGTSPYSNFAWTGPNSFTGNTEDVSGLKSGNYTCSFKDANGCSFTTQAIQVTHPAAISLPSANITINNVKCNGAATGSIAITTAQGGTAPYTYKWSNNATTKDLTNIPAGGYTLTVTDNKGCTFISTLLTVSQPQQALAPNFGSKINAKCFDSADGIIDINPTGGTAPYTYLWTGGATAQDPNTLAPGTYNVTVTDANACTAKLPTDVVIEKPNQPLTATHTTTSAGCAPTGSISVTPNGGWGGYSYNWNPVIPGGGNPTSLPSGTYKLTISDQGGCTLSYQDIVVSGPPSIGLGTTLVTHVKCFAAGNGSINVTPQGGGGGPYAVNWSNGQSGVTISGLVPGDYIPTVTDKDGCTAVFAAIPVNGPQAITATSVITNQTTTPADGAIDLTAQGGTGTLTFAWTGPGAFTASTEDLTGLIGGTYTVVIKDENNCQSIQTFTVGGGLDVSFIKQNACNGDGSITLNITSPPSSAPFTVTWNGGAAPITTSSTTVIIAPLPAGPYIVTVTNNTGQTTTVSTLIDQNALPLAGSTKADPFEDQKNGQITITPPPGSPYSFLWNTGATTEMINALDSGTYVVTITHNISGCKVTYTFKLVRFYFPISSDGQVVNPKCLNSTDGSIILNTTGGAKPYTYKWSNGATSKDILSLTSGTYTVTVTDTRGETKTSSFVLTSQSQLAITNVNETSNYNGFQVSGADQCDGVATVLFGNGSGATTIAWSNGVNTANNTTLCGGAYSVSVTDGLGCVAVYTDALTAPEPIEANETVTKSVSCNGVCDAIVRILPEGGLEPYKVVWSNGLNDPLVLQGEFSEAVNLCAGSYTVTITDDNNVVKTFNISVTEPAPITVSFSLIEPTTFNSCDGEVLVSAPAAQAPVTYTWSGSFGSNGTAQRAEGLCAGEVVSFVIIDAKGCTVTASDTIPYDDECLHVRPVISPAQQDGKNDFVLITCIENVEHQFEIFNRWGQLVFQTENYLNTEDVDPTSDRTWFGLDKNGNPYAEGVYYYVLNYVDENGNPQQRKGHINLLK